MRQNRWILIRISFDASRFDELSTWEKLRSMKVTGQIQGNLSPELKNNHFTVTILLPEFMTKDVLHEAKNTEGMTAELPPPKQKRKKRK